MLKQATQQAIKYLFALLFLVVSNGIHAQKYTFECWTSPGMEGDSCDICPTSVISSRSFDGLLIYLDSVPYKWIDQPYSVRLRPGEILEFWEHTRAPEHTFAPEKIAIALWQTHFSTIEGFRDSVFCAGVTPTFRQPRLYAAPGPDTTGYYIALSPENSAVLLKGGSNINLDNVADTIIINATGGGGGSGTVTSIGYVAPAAGVTISGTNPVTTTGTWTFALANDLAALESISFNGFAARTGTDTWAVRTLTAGTGISITNGGGILGDPVISATNNGTVTSVGLSMPSIFSVTGSPVTISGTLTAALATQAANIVFAGPTAGGAAVPTFRALVTADLANNIITTAKIADDAVTYAKMQNAAANNVFLGNNNGAGTDFEELTVAQAQTMAGWIDGTGVANRIAYWSDANTLSNDAAFVVDATNDRATVTGTVNGTLAGEGFLNLRGGAITGSTNALYADANVSATWGMVLENIRNLAGAEAKIEIKVGGTSAADPYMLYSVPSGTSTAIGVDNSDADKFKITPGGTAPGSTANKGMTFSTDAATLVGVNDDTPTYPMDVSGLNRATLFITRQIAPNTYSSTNFAFGNGAGTGPLYISGSGSGNWFNIQFRTGTAPVNNGTIFTCTYPTAFPFSNTWPVFSAFNAAAATDITKFRIGNISATTFTFVANGTLTASTDYAFIFHVGGSSSTN